MSFDVEREAGRFIDEFLDECFPSDIDFPRSEARHLIMNYLTRCRDAAEEADVKAVCWECHEGRKLGWRESAVVPNWYHDTLRGAESCTASPIHERRRKREEPPDE